MIVLSLFFLLKQDVPLVVPLSSLFCESRFRSVVSLFLDVNILCCIQQASEQYVRHSNTIRSSTKTCMRMRTLNQEPVQKAEEPVTAIHENQSPRAVPSA